MKILFCKNNFAGPISGADEIVVTYAIELKAAGHEPSLLLVQPPSKSEALVARLRAADVRLDTLASTAFSTSLATARRLLIRAMRTFTPASDLILSNSRKVVFNLLQQYHKSCCEYLKRTRPDVIHVLTPDPGAVMLIRAAHETNIPVVYQEVGIPFHPPGFEKVYERFVSVLPLCAEVTALSPLLAQELSRVAPHVGPAKVLPLISPDHNGIPVRERKRDVVTFGFAARLEHLKGPLRLLEAFGIAHQTHAQMELTIAGDGSQRAEFINRSRSLGLEQKCQLVGVYKTLKERSEFMASFDVFVLPSLTEGTPNVIIEAMAHGKPIIANAVGGVPDLVTDDVGILVPPDDIQALAAAMVRLSRDSDLRGKMGVAARKKYEQLFTPQAVLPVLVDLYRGVVAGHANGGSSEAQV
ncbi:MAG TPA: glycosyltransferase family 4 protein [Pyrinomonadaceae bacterium]|nr:glycosyltransferase family 4 protein [Pyrinomonadaceae bacterium]